MAEMKAYYSTKEAKELLEESNITDAKDDQVLLRWIREGKIKAELKNRKSGYRIEGESLKKFIKEYEKSKDKVDKVDKVDRKKLTTKLLQELRIENGELYAENIRLKKELERLKKEEYKQFTCENCDTITIKVK